jgi:plastocyanin
VTRWALPVVAVLVLAGCGGSAADAGDSDAASAGTVEMAKSYRFEPEETTVSAGTTVIWTNNDNFTHNVVIADELVGTAEPGQSIERTFADAGTYDYICSLHPTDMTGVVTVTE